MSLTVFNRGLAPRKELVQEASASLVKDGYLLADDVPKVVQRAGDHWDLLARRSGTTTARVEPGP
jgi:hypothetical protein